MTTNVDPPPAILDVGRIAIVCDFREENWPSMDLVADKLHEGIVARSQRADTVALVRPPMRRIAGRLPLIGRARQALNADRFLNRFVSYPRYIRKCAHEFDAIHIADHSYAHLVHSLPCSRTGVYCHDLDAFRCLISPDLEPRPRWFRTIARRVLTGMQSAAVVFYSTDAVREQIERHALLDPVRLVHAPYGVSDEFAPEAAGLGAAASIVEGWGVTPFLLHVGSCIPRKRIDVLLDVFAEVRQTHPDLLLVHVGGELNAEQSAQIARLGIGSHVRSLEVGQSREVVADLYRRASLVLLPSEAEGFGLPVVEALACGTVVVASDIPVLREVGGSAAVYCTVGAVDEWTDVVNQLLDDRSLAPDLALRLARARAYSWSSHADTILEAYCRLL